MHGVIDLRLICEHGLHLAYELYKRTGAIVDTGIL